MSDVSRPDTGQTSGRKAGRKDLLNGAAPQPLSWERRIAEARKHKADALAKTARSAAPADAPPPPPVVALGEVDTETVPASSEPPAWMITDAEPPVAPAAAPEEPAVAPPVAAAAAAAPRRSRWLDRGAAVFTIAVLAALYFTGQFDPAPQIATVTPPAAVTPAPAEPEAAPAPEVAAALPQTRPLARPEAAPAEGAATQAALVLPDTATGSLSDTATAPAAAPATAPATAPAATAEPALPIVAAPEPATASPAPEQTLAAETPSAIATLTAPADAPEVAPDAPEALAALAAPETALPTAPEATAPGAALNSAAPVIAAIPPAARPWDPRGRDLAAAQNLRIILTTSSAMSATQRAGFEAAIESFGFSIGTAQTAGFRISENQVRFFHPEDINAAGALADAVGARVRDFTSFRPAPPPGTLEIYLNAEGLAPLQPASAGEALDRLRDRLAEAIRRGDHL